MLTCLLRLLYGAKTHGSVCLSLLAADPLPQPLFFSFFFCPLSITSYSSSLSPQSAEEHPHLQILVADWFLESWWEAISNVLCGGECNLASLYNPLQLIHWMSLFLESTYYLTRADAIRWKYRVFGMQFIKTCFGASWRDTGSES